MYLCHVDLGLEGVPIHRRIGFGGIVILQRALVVTMGFGGKLYSNDDNSKKEP